MSTGQLRDRQQFLKRADTVEKGLVILCASNFTHSMAHELDRGRVSGQKFLIVFFGLTYWGDICRPLLEIDNVSIV